MKKLLTLFICLCTISCFSQSIKLSPSLDYIESRKDFLGGEVGLEYPLNSQWTVEANGSFTTREDGYYLTTRRLDTVTFNFLQIKSQVNYYFSDHTKGFYTGFTAGYATINAKTKNTDLEVQIDEVGFEKDNRGQFITGIPVGYKAVFNQLFQLNLVSGIHCLSCGSENTLFVLPFRAGLVYSFN